MSLDHAGLTLFSWGYRGWGNRTAELVEAVDAVERSRGRGPPVFVDVRASRRVRAAGFRQQAFARLLGPERYRWLPGLGNEAVLTGAARGRFVDPGQAVELLRLAADLHGARRRAVFFCSCPAPTAACHRHWVAPVLLELARRRRQRVTVVEWPGFESEPRKVLEVRVAAKVVKALAAGARGAVPLGERMPPPSLLGLPWLTPVSLVDAGTGEVVGAMLGGPALHRAGAWRLPALAGALPPRVGLRIQRDERRALQLLPRAWPAGEPAQEPFEWSPE